MTMTRDSKTAAAPANIQDSFLNHVRRERLAVAIKLVDGSGFEGRIKNFDRFALIIEQDGVDLMIFKHAIATIASPRPLGNYFVPAES